ncbi:MAG: hypothetical protein ACLFTP_09695 [Rhodosalinus sp.]
MRLSALCLAAFALTACGVPPTISLPVVGKLSNGDTAQGSVLIDTTTMEGAFDMTTLRGLSCAGTYDARQARSTIVIPVTCNNGQQGRVIATRDGGGMAGTATAQLENGMTGRFLFGAVSAQQQAEFLD